jgi:hypothetical protein
MFAFFGIPRIARRSSGADVGDKIAGGRGGQ